MLFCRITYTSLVLSGHRDALFCEERGKEIGTDGVEISRPGGLQLGTPRFQPSPAKPFAGETSGWLGKIHHNNTTAAYR